MSKINCLRVINLNYNHNTIRIEDETFRFEGENTLLSLQNGGGKSVLVQMMIAPFVRKRYRDTPDRDFASFFTTSRPTFILTEWVLDGGTGYVLVGMMVRQKQASQYDDTQDELDMVNFIHEYRKPNEFNIHNLPVIEVNGKEKKLKGFEACKRMFEEARKKIGLAFQYYDMNQQIQQKKYFDRLKEFQINHTEWETIIKKVNLKESGLSEFFKDAKDEAGLVEKWFLSAVESKLNKDENRIKEFADIIYKFIRQYRDNQTKIEKKETILAFQSDAHLINEKAEAYLNAQLLKEEYEDKIAFLRESLMSLKSGLERDKFLLEENIDRFKDELQSIYYEEISYQIYGLVDEQELMKKKREDIEKEMNQVKKIIDELIYRIHTMECAILYEEYRDCSKEVQELENQLEILREEEQNLLPERNLLGYNLRCYYEEAFQKQKQHLEELENLYVSKQEKLKELKNEEDRIQKQLQKISGTLAEVKTRMNTFNKLEADFNNQYNENLARNILGKYEDGTLEVIKIQLQEEYEKLQSYIATQKQKKDQTDESIVSCSRDIEDNSKKMGELEIKIAQQEELFREYEKQLENRGRILRFIGLKQEDLFKMPIIEETFNKVIEDLQHVKRELEKQKEELEEEYTKLETGKVIELPKEFIDLLNDHDLTWIYGMDWLKKNGNTLEANQQLLKNNPMLPYSIIMNDKNLKQLAESTVDFYTSFPIPIIRREDLDYVSDKDAGCIYEMERIRFFVMFNHHLLDDKALQELLNSKRNQIERLRHLIHQKDEEIKEYENKYNEIKYQTVTEERYQNCIKERERLKQEKEELEDLLKELRNQKDELQHLSKELSENIEGANRQEQLLSRKIKDFMKLCKGYEEYLNDLNRMEKTNKEADQLREKLSECKHSMDEIERSMRDIVENRARDESKLEELRNKVNLYENFKEGERIHKDIEDIEARFEALNKKISDDEKQLEERLRKARKRFESKETQLSNRATEYGLAESDYKDVAIDEFADKEAKREKKAQDELYRKLNTQYNEIRTNIAVLENNINNKINDMKDKFSRQEPVPREQIIDIEFKKRAQIKQLEIEKEADKLKNCEEKLNSYNNNLSGLAEFNHFVVRESANLDKELTEYQGKTLADLSGNQLDDFRGKLVKNYRASLRDMDENKEDLKKCLDEILRKEAYEDEFFKRPIETMISLVDMPQSVLEQLTIVLTSYQNLLEKLEVDIAIVEKERQKVIEMLLEYVADINKNLGKIDRNSSIAVRGRPIKMLNIKIPEWEANENIYKLRLQDFVDEIVRRGLQRLDLNENIEEMIGAYITTKNLYDTVVGIGNISIKLYKIEAQREYPISWAEVSKNSGGEGFLSAFVVLSSLLSYMRREETDLFFERVEGKVLVMDNPFAQTNAEHLLKPLMEFAKKNNTQLICLSGLGGESIYNRFDNIYVLNLVSSGLQKNIQYVKGERVKGEEDFLFIQPAQVKVEDMEQLRLLF